MAFCGSKWMNPWLLFKLLPYIRPTEKVPLTVSIIHWYLQNLVYIRMFFTRFMWYVSVVDSSICVLDGARVQEYSVNRFIWGIKDIQSQGIQGASKQLNSNKALIGVWPSAGLLCAGTNSHWQSRWVVDLSVKWSSRTRQNKLASLWISSWNTLKGIICQ